MQNKTGGTNACGTTSLTKEKSNDRYQRIASANFDSSTPVGASHDPVDATSFGKKGRKYRPETNGDQPNGRGASNRKTFRGGVAAVERLGDNGARCIERK
jgi:hypothetical protein